MTEKNGNHYDEKITLRELIGRGHGLITYLLAQWKVVALCVVLGGVVGLVYTFRRPVYTAETTFALEDMNSGSSISGLASTVGLNVGALTGQEDNLFKGENILELYKSKKMLIEAILKEVEYNGKKERLIYPFARELEWDEKWLGKPYLKDISFDLPRDQFTHRHDSILIEVVEKLHDKFLSVTKPSRRLNIISVKVSFKDPVFAKSFNQQLVKVVNDFYFASKTRKSAQTLATIQAQADSMKAALNTSMVELATTLEATPNLNTLYRKKTVPIQEHQIDMQISLAAYAEIVKNLELSRLNHLERQPLIQIIDQPLEYLENNKWNWYKGLVIGLFAGGLISLLGLGTFYVIVLTLREEEKTNI